MTVSLFQSQLSGFNNHLLRVKQASAFFEIGLIHQVNVVTVFDKLSRHYDRIKKSNIPFSCVTRAKILVILLLCKVIRVRDYGKKCHILSSLEF